jgi:hypothetical protein
MNQFITFREEINNETGYFILQRDFPHYLCRIAEQPIVNFIQPIPITNYNLWLIFNATLRGNYIPSYKDIGAEIISVMNSMATWFFENRILPNEKKYKKWKIQ